MEAVANFHPAISRSAIVLGDSKKNIYLVVEIAENYREYSGDIRKELRERYENTIWNEIARSMAVVILKFGTNFPTDVRHNSKIERRFLSKMLNLN
jgi:hypothetical protein